MKPLEQITVKTAGNGLKLQCRDLVDRSSWVVCWASSNCSCIRPRAGQMRSRGQWAKFLHSLGNISQGERPFALSVLRRSLTTVEQPLLYHWALHRSPCGLQSCRTSKRASSEHSRALQYRASADHAACRVAARSTYRISKSWLLGERAENDRTHPFMSPRIDSIPHSRMPGNNTVHRSHRLPHEHPLEPPSLHLESSLLIFLLWLQYCQTGTSITSIYCIPVTDSNVAFPLTLPRSIKKPLAMTFPSANIVKSTSSNLRCLTKTCLVINRSAS